MERQCYIINIKSGRYAGKSGVGIIEDDEAGIFLNNDPIMTWFAIDKCEIIRKI